MKPFTHYKTAYATKTAKVRRESTLLDIAKMLREADEEPIVKTAEKETGEDSLDDQVDKYFADYEAEAKSAKTEGLDFRAMTRRFLIEAGEDEEEKDKDAADDTPKEPVKPTSDDIDVKAFASHVVRLIDNYDTLLEVRNTLLRRAVNFLLETYEPEVAESFKEELLETHGMEIGKSAADKEDDIQAPKAGAAGPAGGEGGAP